MKGRFTPWLAMALIFLIGAITGAALAIGSHSAWAHPPGPKQMQSHWLGRLNDRLHLTPDQQGKIDPILGQAGEQIRKMHQDEMDKIRQILDEADAQITPLLTTEQQAEFAKMHRERPHDFHHMHHWGEPPPPEAAPNPPPEPGSPPGH